MSFGQSEPPLYYRYLEDLALRLADRKGPLIFKLIETLESIPVDSAHLRRLVAERGEFTIKTGDNLAWVLSTLPEADRHDFAIKQHHKIRLGIKLERVLKKLLPADRQEFREFVEARWQAERGAERSDAALVAERGLFAGSPEDGAGSAETMAAGAAGVMPQEEAGDADAEGEAPEREADVADAAAISPARR